MILLYPKFIGFSIFINICKLSNKGSPYTFTICRSYYIKSSSRHPKSIILIINRITGNMIDYVKTVNTQYNNERRVKDVDHVMLCIESRVPSGHLMLEQRWIVAEIRSCRCSELHFDLDPTYSARRVLYAHTPTHQLIAIPAGRRTWRWNNVEIWFEKKRNHLTPNKFRRCSNIMCPLSPTGDATWVLTLWFSLFSLTPLFIQNSAFYYHHKKSCQERYSIQGNKHLHTHLYCLWYSFMYS